MGVAESWTRLSDFDFEVSGFDHWLLILKPHMMLPLTDLGQGVRVALNCLSQQTACPSRPRKH